MINVRTYTIGGKQCKEYSYEFQTMDGAIHKGGPYDDESTAKQEEHHNAIKILQSITPKLKIRFPIPATVTISIEEYTELRKVYEERITELCNRCMVKPEEE